MYIKKGVNYKIRSDLEIYRQKTFENISIELIYPFKTLLLSNIYHSPNPPSNCTPLSHTSDFLELLDEHLSKLSDSNKDSYVFLDANIDLLKLNTSTLPNDYMNVNFSNGFIQLITRATRVQGRHFSLIDHILTNSKHDNYCTGTIVSDISDHFFNFIKLPLVKQKIKIKQVTKRNFSEVNILNFKTSLSNNTWQDTLNTNDVNLAFNHFWEDFSTLYNLHFPIKKFKFNKNYHKVNDYLTNGLLVSRKTKLELCKKAAKDRTELSIQKYRTYRNIFNSLIRLSKKMYFNNGLQQNKKNPKKTWQLQGGQMKSGQIVFFS